MGNYRPRVTPLKVRETLLQTAQGLKGQTWPIVQAANTSAPATGDIYAQALGLLAGDIVTNLIWYAGVAPSGLTLVRAGLLDSTGKVLVISADVHTTFTAAGQLTIPMSAPFTITADGLYRPALIQVGTTPGALIRAAAGITGFAASVGGGVTASRLAAQSDLPAVAASMTITATGIAFWAAWN